MIAPETFRQFALSLPETVEAPHFDIISFKVKGKIFATLNIPEQRCTLKFSPELQDVFVALGKGAVFSVPNRWGKLGWTHIQLDAGEWPLCADALCTAWWETAPASVKKKYPDIGGPTDEEMAS